MSSIGRSSVWLGTILGSTLLSAPAQELTWEYSVQVSATIQSNPPALSFSWPQDMATLPAYYTVSRKAPGDSNWGPPTVLPGTSTQYVDTAITPGFAYEYQFYKSTSDHVGYGYICAGINVPALENRGKLVLLVDQTFAADLAGELSRLQQDLVGDGWVVLRHDVPRQASVPAVKAIIKADYDADPPNVKALFLFGRIPVPYSGNAAPDGHDEHIGAWPADVYYANMSGVWTDTTVNNCNSDSAMYYNVPGDGKFDQSEIPGTVEIQVGRVDLANMPGMGSDGQPTFPSECELLRRYLNKDHNYRHKVFSLPPRGLVYDGAGARGGEAFAANAWRNYAPLLGPPAARSLNAGEFLPILQTNGYQWAFATGGGAPDEMAGLGGAHTFWYYASGTTLDVVEMDMHAAFVMMLGSSLGNWDYQDDIMRGVLATPTCGLACVYAGRPHWFFHYMGVGETLGYCTRLTQNNHDHGLYRNQSNNFAGFVHTALMGDPTLRLHTLAPVSALRAVSLPQGFQLTWSPSPDAVLGYYVYRATNASEPFVRLTPGLLAQTNFLDASNFPGIRTYMVRAVKLQTSASGSYTNLSQGIFATISAPPGLRVFPSGDVTLTINATPDRTYRILWSNSLTNQNWTPLRNDLLATAPTVTCSISLTGTLTGVGWLATNFETSGAYVWADDALPQGAIVGSDGELWNWVTQNPTPFSGSVAAQSTIRAGLHQQYFSRASATMTISTGDVLLAYVYLDPANRPSEIMLQWNDGQTWEHRAYWGGNLITYGANGTAGRIYEGSLPDAGRWTALQVPAADVALAGRTVSGLALTLYDGRATWDYAGKYSASGGMATNTPPPAIPSQRFYKVLLLP